MKETFSNRQHRFEQKKIQALEQQSHEVADQIDQMKEDLEELERLYSSDPLPQTSSFQSPQGQSESQRQAQPWGNYIFLLLLTLLLIGINVGL